LITVINALLLPLVLLFLRYTSQYRYWTAGCTTNGSWFNSLQGHRTYSSPQHPDRLETPASIPFIFYRVVVRKGGGGGFLGKNVSRV